MAPGIVENPKVNAEEAVEGTAPNGTPTVSDVVVVGAGPAGLMLATNLVRYGIKVEIVDDRPNQTSAGRADGIQPKTIETLRQMKLIDPLLRQGVKVYDICYWQSAPNKPLHRTERQIHYPQNIIDVIDPNLLILHQGIIEGVFIDDLRSRGVDVQRNLAFAEIAKSSAKQPSDPLHVICDVKGTDSTKELLTNYVVGCDGAHSKVRRCIPDAEPVGESSESVWGVLDGELDTDFPDLWSKTIVYSETVGSVLIIPRERNMTRFYIELRPELRLGKEVAQDFVMESARQIMSPYRLEWRTVEWFGKYQIGQKVAQRFFDDEKRILIAGDASHTHSPKAAQGMNTSMHDSWNLCWKLNLAIRGLAKPVLLETYQEERKKIAHDLIEFDYEHANAFHEGDSKALAENFTKNVRFISGVGAEYGENVLNRPSLVQAAAKPGCLLPPAKVTRYIDANPVDVQLDIPMLGQFRIFILSHDVHKAMPFLDKLCSQAGSSLSAVGRLAQATDSSYRSQPRIEAQTDEFLRPDRYTPFSHLSTWSLITTMPKENVEIADLPPVLRDSCWTFYMDDVPEKDTRGLRCTEKWVGKLDEDEVAIVTVRPDGYVGSVGRWIATADKGRAACEWLDDYFAGFLTV